ncbi:hypothetical protein ACF09L_09680 [Streptomyces sp. NPDC014779]|uniref:hypothetical protein n=1 Tax=unclassified Streptomyces TaxID=2593676 RepID=UPI0033EEE4FE
MILVKNLPRDSAVQRELHGEAAEWSISDHLLAATVDHLAVANWMFQCVNSDEDGETPDPPKPVPRPGVADEDEDGADENPSAEGTGDESVSPLALARFFG